MSIAFFYFFSSTLILSSLLSITLKNPVQGVLSLIAAFISASCLFFIIGAEFLGASTIIVYVGAVAVLFLFVVMMLDTDYKELKKERRLSRKLKIPLAIFSVAISIYFFQESDGLIEMIKSSSLLAQKPEQNITTIAKVLYTNYLVAFEMSGLILLAAMLGAILLSLRLKNSAKKQDIHTQIIRQKTVTLVKPAIGEGVKL
jgi:NADH-quinone oxidoreductase subunit J